MLLKWRLFRTSLTFLQINHIKEASAAFLLHLAKRNADVALIQEPWILVDIILGLERWSLGFLQPTGKRRACFLGKKILKIFLPLNFSNEDYVAAAVEGS